MVGKNAKNDKTSNMFTLLRAHKNVPGFILSHYRHSFYLLPYKPPSRLKINIQHFPLQGQRAYISDMY